MEDPAWINGAERLKSDASSLTATDHEVSDIYTMVSIRVQPINAAYFPLFCFIGTFLLMDYFAFVLILL